MLEIVFESTSREFRPGETIAGEVSWESLPANSEFVGVRLLWYTQGKGDRDMDLVADSDVAITAAELGVGSRRFEFIAPHRPSSFSGKLIELTWAVEVVILPAKESILETISISSTGARITLDKNFDDSFTKRKRKFWASNR